MGANFKLDNLEKKQEIIEYLRSSNEYEVKKVSSRDWNLRRTAKSFEIHGDELFLNRGGRLLEVICCDETEKINSILQRIHLPGHRGNFFSNKTYF